MFESLTPHTKDKRPFLKVRIGNESNGKFLDVQDAIWDTGATQTCISKDVAEALELQMHGKGYATTANGDASFSTARLILTRYPIVTASSVVLLASRGAWPVSKKDWRMSAVSCSSNTST